MIGNATETAFANLIAPESGRAVDPFADPEVVRLTAVNLELAVKNLMTASTPPECIVLTADICSHRLIARPTADGDVSVLVFNE